MSPSYKPISNAERICGSLCVFACVSVCVCERERECACVFKRESESVRKRESVKDFVKHCKNHVNIEHGKMQLKAKKIF